MVAGAWHALVAGRLREYRPRSGGVAEDLGENGEIRGVRVTFPVFEPCLTDIKIEI